MTHHRVVLPNPRKTAHEIAEGIHKKEFKRTILAVILIGCITFGGAAFYDQQSGGPEARSASVSANRILDGFEDIITRSECSNTYINADNIAQANLLLAFGAIIEGSATTGVITQEDVALVRQTRVARRHYLELRSRINEFCDTNNPDGVQPLRANEMPEIIVVEEN